MNFGFWPSRQIVHCSVCGCDPATPRLSAATDAAARAAWRSSPPSKLPDQIATVFLLLALFGKQIDYPLSVGFVGHAV
jgi:hypothetical protein